MSGGGEDGLVDTPPGTPERQNSELVRPGTPHDHVPTLFGLGPVMTEPSSPSPAHTHKFKTTPRRRRQRQLSAVLVRVRDMQRAIDELARDLEELIE